MSYVQDAPPHSKDNLFGNPYHYDDNGFQCRLNRPFSVRPYLGSRYDRPDKDRKEYGVSYGSSRLEEFGTELEPQRHLAHKPCTDL